MKKYPQQKWLLWLVVILLLTNILTLSFYWLKEKPGHGPAPTQADKEKRMGQFMVNELKFTPDQEAIYWKLRDTLIMAQRPVMDSIRSSKKRYFDLLKMQHGAEYDSLILARGNAVTTLQRQLDLITMHHFEKVRALCTEEQLVKFDTVIAEIVNRMTSPRKSGSGKPDSTKTK